MKVFSYTNMGGKRHNEDCLRVSEIGDKRVFVVADGLGGHQKGEVASQTVADAIVSSIKPDDAIDRDYLVDLFMAANKTLLDKQVESKIDGMKTTAVMLSICGDEAIWAHVGDSRLYYFSDDEVSVITRDHSVSYTKYMAGDITFDRINDDDDRTSLLRAFGGAADAFQPEVLPEVCKVKPGDAFLLCSDGFWEYVLKHEMLIDFLKSETPEQWAENMLIRHIKRIKTNNDNLSLIAIMI